jgi:hypothetical protein
MRDYIPWSIQDHEEIKSPKRDAGLLFPSITIANIKRTEGVIIRQRLNESFSARKPQNE